MDTNRKIDLSKNEVFDPKFEEYIKDIIDTVPIRNLMRYPKENRLLKAYSTFFEIPKNNIALGFGSSDLLRRLFSLYKNKTIFIPPFEFSLSYTYSKIFNMKLVPLNKAQVVYLGNPGSFKNTFNSNYILKVIKRGYPILIIDEVYSLYFNKSYKKEILNSDNVYIVDSVSKTWGMCGFRSGIVVSSSKNIDRLNSLYKGINSNSISAEVIPIILQDTLILKEHIQRILEGKIYLESKIPSIPIEAPYTIIPKYYLTPNIKNNIIYLEFENKIRISGTTLDVFKKLGI